MPLLWHVGFYAVFLVFPFVWAKEYRDRQVPWIVSALAGPAQFALVFLLMRKAYPNPVMGLVPASVRPIEAGTVARALLRATIDNAPGVQMLSSARLQALGRAPPG